MAGWWAWAVAVQIGAFDGRGPWCADPVTGRITKQDRPGARLPGVTRSVPHLSDNGQGVNQPGACLPGVLDPAEARHGRSELDDFGHEYHDLVMPELIRWFRYLSARLRHVRVLNGDWSRLTTTGATLSLPVRQGKGPCGMFLDPPYGDVRAGALYSTDSFTVADEVRGWCLRNGNNPNYRIVLAGFDTEHDSLEADGWTVHEWFQDGFLTGGMGNIGQDGHQQHRERLWASPGCLPVDGDAQMELFQ